MGISYCFCIKWTFFSVDNCISILGIIINASVAIWIVKTIQNRFTNSRILKDHFIEEIKEIRDEYKLFLNNLYSSKTKAQTAISWFKLMNIKVSNTMEFINKSYKINKDILNPYQNDLRELVTNNDDFNNNYKSTSGIHFSEESRMHLIQFQQKNYHLFTEIIIRINNYKK